MQFKTAYLTPKAVTVMNPSNPNKAWAARGKIFERNSVHKIRKKQI